MKAFLVKDVSLMVDGKEINPAHRFRRAVSRQALIDALHGTDRQKLEYAALRVATRECIQLWVTGTFVNDPKRFDSTVRHCVHQAERLRRIAIRMGVYKP